MTVVARATVELGGETADLEKALSHAQAEMRKAGQTLQDIGRSMSLYVTLPLTGIGAAAFKVAADFDESLRHIEGLVGVQRDVIEGWSKDIRDLAVQYGKSGKEAAEALYFITSAGVSTADAMGVLEIALKASASGLGETQVLADALTSVINAYGAENVSAAKAADILTMAVRAGKVEADAFAPVLGRLLPTAAAMGISFEQVAGTLAVMSRTGLDAAEASTSLNAIMSTLLSPSQQAAKALAEVGLSMTELRAQAKGPTGLLDVMRRLDETFRKLGPAGEEAFATVVPNVRAFRGVMNVLAQDSASVDTVLKQVYNSAGTTGEAFAAAARGPAFQFRKAMAEMKDALLSIGETVVKVLGPALSQVATIFRAAATWFASLGETTRTVVVVVAALTAGIGPLLVAMGLLIQAVGGLSGALAVLKVAIGPAGWMVLGLTAIAFGVQQWVKEKQHLNQVLSDSKTAVDNYRTSLFGLNKEALQFNWAQIALEFNKQRAEVTALDAQLKTLRTTMTGATQAEFTAREQALTQQLALANIALAEKKGKLDATVQAMVRLQGATVPTTDALKNFTGGTGEASAAVKAYTTVLDTLAAAERAIPLLEAAIGPSYQANAERVKAYRTAVEGLVQVIATHKDQIPGADAALRSTSQQYIVLRDVLSQVNGNLVPTVKSTERAEFAMIKLRTSTFATKPALQEMSTGMRALASSMETVTALGLAAFINFARGAKNAFKDFIDQALKELSRLLIKLAATKIIKAIFGVGLFAEGGYLAAGQMGIVGEAGPELIRGGSSGATITPLADAIEPSTSRASASAASVASELLAMIGPPPTILSPEAAALDTYWRRLFGALAADGRRRGVLV